jgi:hypothetical protein
MKAEVPALLITDHLHQTVVGGYVLAGVLVALQSSRAFHDVPGPCIHATGAKARSSHWPTHASSRTRAIYRIVCALRFAPIRSSGFQNAMP